MSMLTFYVNRAGKKLPARDRTTLMRAKQELRKLVRPRASACQRCADARSDQRQFRPRTELSFAVGALAGAAASAGRTRVADRGARPEARAARRPRDSCDSVDDGWGIAAPSAVCAAFMTCLVVSRCSPAAASAPCPRRAALPGRRRLWLAAFAGGARARSTVSRRRARRSGRRRPCRRNLRRQRQDAGAAHQPLTISSQNKLPHCPPFFPLSASRSFSVATRRGPRKGPASSDRPAREAQICRPSSRPG